VLECFLRKREESTRTMLARISIVLLACVLSSVSLKAQGQPVPIVTDRPSVTDSRVAVPAGSIQAENGFLDNSSGRYEPNYHPPWI